MDWKRISWTDRDYFIMSKVFPQVIIETGPDLFTFRSSKTTLQLLTHIYLSNDESRIAAFVLAEGSKILASKEGGEVANATRVDLFVSSLWSYQTFTRANVLERFLTYGIFGVLPKWKAILLKPIVVFKNVSSFDSIFLGYQYWIFEQLAQGNATKVVFE